MATCACASPNDVPLKKTPLYADHVRLGARMTPFGGWDMPLQYKGQLAEHEAVRKGVGMFDVSHMGQARFRGARALEYLQRLVPGNIARLGDGASLYTQLCTPTGGVVDDLIISRLGPEHFFTVINASTSEKDVAWMRQQAAALGFGDVSIENESARWAMIAVQGPEAFRVLNALVPGGDWSATPAFTLHSFVYEGEEHYLSRTGYTGEVGGEILCPAAKASAWWGRLLDAGVQPCGLAARDSLRLEVGYCLYGNDLDETTSPVEAGLGWSVGWKKSEPFVGRDVLERHRAQGVTRRLVGLKLATRRPLRHGDPVVLEDGAKVGEVTSGGYSPGLGVGVGLAYVAASALDAKSPIFVQTRAEKCPAEVTKPPFVRTSLSKA